MTEGPSVSRLRQLLEESHADDIAFLSELVSISSHTSDTRGVQAVLDRAETQLSALGLSTRRVQVNDAADLLVAQNYSATSGATPSTLICHGDTVHRKGRLPCVLEVKDGNGLGPGALDDKGGIVAILSALTALKNCGALAHIPVKVIVSPDEERGSTSAKAAIVDNAKGSRQALVFEIGRENNAVVTSRKGLAVYRVDVTGQASHAGNDHSSGSSAIEALARFTIGIHEITNYERGVTTNVAPVAGGSGPNVISDHATATFEIRAETAVQLNEAIGVADGLARDLTNDRIRVALTQKIAIAPMEESRANRALCESYLAAARSCGLHSERLGRMVGGISDANHVSTLGFGVIDGLGPAGGDAHQPTEWVDLKSITEKALILSRFLVGENYPPRT